VTGITFWRNSGPYSGSWTLASITPHAQGYWCECQAKMISYGKNSAVGEIQLRCNSVNFTLVAAHDPNHGDALGNMP
jgi:hypothetical protein